MFDTIETIGVNVIVEIICVADKVFTAGAKLIILGVESVETLICKVWGL